MPLDNAIKALEAGGICCRNDLNNKYTDVSSNKIQHSREKELILNSSMDKEPVQVNKSIHNTINLLWNPNNNTLYRFHRNAHLKDQNEFFNPLTYGKICVIEIDIIQLLKHEKVYWVTSDMNFARREANYSNCSTEYSKYHWNKIFDYQKTRDTNEYRSAELIIFIENLDEIYTNPIHPKYINRILVPEKDHSICIELLGKYQKELIGLPDYYQDLFTTKKRLLEPESKFIQSIIEMEKHIDKIDYKTYCKFITHLSNIEKIKWHKSSSQIYDVPIEDSNYIKPEMAYSFHGKMHTVRVMFWSMLLWYLTSQDKDFLRPLIYSAYIHDFGRIDNNPHDYNHGYRSFKKYYGYLKRSKISKNDINLIAQAVNYHSKTDEYCKDMNEIDMLLKDADALDRGRFGKPNSNSGCKINFLRTPIFKNDKISELLPLNAHALYALADQQGIYTGEKYSPYKTFEKHIINSLYAIIQNEDIFTPEQLEKAKLMREYITTAPIPEYLI